MEQIASLQILLSALVLSSVYVLVALGLNLVYGTMRLLNVAHGDLMMLGGYVAYWSFILLGIGTLGSMFGAAALCALLGFILYQLLLRRFLSNSKFAARLESNSMIIFFGLSIIVQNLMSLAFSADPRSYSYMNSIVELGPVRVEASRLVVLGVGVAAATACVLFFRYSRLGLAARALIQQKDAAALVGIDANRINLIVFCLGFGLAGLAGALVSMTEAITPFGGFQYTIAAFVIIILGGLGNIWGGIVGGVLLAFIEIYGSALTSTAYRSIIVYGVFVAVLCLRPQGILGKRIA